MTIIINVEHNSVFPNTVRGLHESGALTAQGPSNSVTGSGLLICLGGALYKHCRPLQASTHAAIPLSIKNNMDR